MAVKTIVANTDQTGFNAESLIAAVDALDTSPYIGFVYGSGFEAQPALLTRIAEKLPIIGNAPDTISALKNPTRFFAALGQLSINFPAVRDSIAAKDAACYLIKYGGGSGGAHIRLAQGHETLPGEHYYYQQNIAGKAVSLLFLADRHSVEVIGFNEQWPSPSADLPYRYGGAVSQSALSRAVKAQLCDAAKKVTQTFGLVGLNSLDAIVTIDDAVYVLEINPRLSATIDLYADAQPDLLQRHVHTALNMTHCLPDHFCQHDAVMQTPIPSCAHAIVYAEDNMEIALPEWPDWVTDTAKPANGVINMQRGVPVCTVKATAVDAASAKKLVLQRVEILKNLLQSCSKHTR